MAETNTGDRLLAEIREHRKVIATLRQWPLAQTGQRLLLLECQWACLSAALAAYGTEPEAQARAEFYRTLALSLVELSEEELRELLNNLRERACNPGS